MESLGPKWLSYKEAEKMTTTNVHMGYIGGVKIGGTSYFMQSSSLNPNQSITAPDLVAGHEMRRGWVYGKVDPSGNVSGPLHEGSESLWTTAFDRTADKDHLDNTVAVELAFYKGGGWKFNECVIKSLEISASAGEVVTFTADFAGRTAVQAAGEPTAVDCSKLMTWDRCVFSVDVPAITQLQSISFNLNNNVTPIYAIQSTVGDLYPVDLPCGVREITGNMSAYAQGPIFDTGLGADSWASYEADTAQKDVNFSVGTIVDVTFKAVFSRPKGSAAPSGPAIYTLEFTAVCDAN